MAGRALEGAEVSGVPLAIVALAGAAVVLAGGRRRPGVQPARPAQPAALPRHRASPSARTGSGCSSTTPRSPRPSALAALVVILAEGGLTTRWSRGPPAVAARPSSLSTSGSRSASRSPRGRRAGCWTRLADRRCCSGAVVSLHRRGRGVLDAARARRCRRRLAATLELESGLNDAPVVHPGHAAVQRRDRLPGRGRRAGRRTSWSSAPRSGSAIGFGGGLGCCAAGRCRRPGSTRWRSSRVCVARLRGGVGRARLRASSPPTWPALVLGNAQLPHRRGHARLRRGAGLAGPDRAVRAARAAGLPEPARVGAAAGAGRRRGRCCCWPGRCRCSRAAVWFRVPLARAGVRVLGRAARGGADRAGDDPADRRRPGGAPVSSTSCSCSWSCSPWCRAPRCPRWPGCSGCRAERAARPRGRRRRRWTSWTPTCCRCGSRPASRLHGVLPARAAAAGRGACSRLVVRDGQGFVPGPDTRLRRGDQLLVVTTAPARAAAERRLRAVGRAGRLAGWLEGDLRRGPGPAGWARVAASPGGPLQ